MKAHSRIHLDQVFISMVGGVLLVLSAAGVVHGVRASWAANLSRRAQLSATPLGVDEILASCRKAYALYPWNYYFSIFAAESAYYRADEVRGAAREARLSQSRLWCDRGLIQNPYKSQLRRLKTRFLWERSPAEAIAYWAAFTEWNFWEPYNHATLAELYAKYGDRRQAEAELRWVEVDGSYGQVRQLVEQELKGWDSLEKGDAGEWGE